MTTYASMCTRIYGPHGTVAHLSPPGAAATPLCAARAKPPALGWLGTLGIEQREVAASLPLCKHCERIAAARDALLTSRPQQQPGQVTAEAGAVSSPVPLPETDAPTAAVTGDAATDPESPAPPEDTSPLAGSPGLAAPEAADGQETLEVPVSVSVRVGTPRPPRAEPLDPLPPERQAPKSPLERILRWLGWS